MVCQNCTHRTVGCHGTCAEYAAFKHKSNTIRESKFQDGENLRDYYAVRSHHNKCVRKPA